MKSFQFLFIFFFIGFLFDLKGQVPKLEFTSIVPLSSKVNSSADELMPILSADGTKMYFTRAVHSKNTAGRFGGHDIWSSSLRNGLWEEAVNVTQFNNKGNNAVLGIDHKGGRIYLLNSYEDSYGSKSGLSFSELKGNVWTTPVVTKIEGIYNQPGNDLYGLNVNDRSDVLMISMEGIESVGEEDLYVSFKFTGWNRFHTSSEDSDDDSKYWWSPPIHLGGVINSVSYEISPFLSADGKTLFFSSDRKGGNGGADIYYSKRLDDSWQEWSEPVNLGRGINSRKFDAYFFIAEDSTIYFSSARKGNFSDIYTSKLVKSEENILQARDEIFVPIAEQVKSREEEELAIDKLKFEVPIIKNEGDLKKLNAIDWNVFFDHNSSNLLLKDLELLENTMAIVKANSNLEVHLIGHTDDIGSHQRNDDLSHSRAEVLRSYFVANDIVKERIFIDGHGEGTPVAENEHHFGREKNRRVTITYYFKGSLKAR